MRWPSSALGVVFAGAFLVPSLAAGGIHLASVSSTGTQGNFASNDPAVSANGRFIAFSTLSDNLVPGDNNVQHDIFLRDRKKKTLRVSIGPGGVEADGGSFNPAVSATGRFVAFASVATNLVPGDTNDVADIFVYDRKKKTMERVSVGPGGVEADALSNFPSLSANGRYVAFESDATNLVPGDTNGVKDVFVYDRKKKTIERVSVASDGTEGDLESGVPSISANGRFVAFDSAATNLVAGDTNGFIDVFVRDREKNTTTRVSVGPGGAEGDAASQSARISPDGRYVVFTSTAANLVPNDQNGSDDIFRYDRKKKETVLVSVGGAGAQGDSNSMRPAVSKHGRFVVFSSEATNLVANDQNGKQDLFLRDVKKKKTKRVSVDSAGGDPNGESARGSLSANGKVIAFTSLAADLVANDQNGTIRDVFWTKRK